MKQTYKPEGACTDPGCYAAACVGSKWCRDHGGMPDIQPKCVLPDCFGKPMAGSAYCASHKPVRPSKRNDKYNGGYCIAVDCTNASIIGSLYCHQHQPPPKGKTEGVKTTGLSEFVRNASPEEKEAVYKEVLTKATDAQNTVIEYVEPDEDHAPGCRRNIPAKACPCKWPDAQPNEPTNLPPMPNGVPSGPNVGKPSYADLELDLKVHKEELQRINELATSEKLKYGELLAANKQLTESNKLLRKQASSYQKDIAKTHKHVKKLARIYKLLKNE